MIPVTPEILHDLQVQKAAYWSAKGVKTKKGVLTYVCANCKHQGGTLIKQGGFMVCADPKICKTRCMKLPIADLAFLSKLRGEQEK